MYMINCIRDVCLRLLKMFKTLISLDVSTTCTGYSKFKVDFDKKEYEYITTDSIKAKDKNIYTRFHTMQTSFETLKLYTGCDLVVFEDYAFNGNRVTQLAEMNGLLKYNYTLNDKPIMTIAPSTIKKWVTGQGRGSKDLVRKAIQEREEFAHIKFKNNDESDSVAVGLAFILKSFGETK